jgi:microcystin-dependent protein
MLDPFLGQIALFPYGYAPQGWADCAGQLLPINQYSQLYSLIGTTYGGNGRTTFGLPDFQGRASLGFGAPPGRQAYAIGQRGGMESVGLTEDTLPAHNHALFASGAQGTINKPGGSLLASPYTGLSDPTTGSIYNPARPNEVMGDLVIGPAGTAPPTPHDNMQPSLVLRYCIALIGILPSRTPGAVQ